MSRFINDEQNEIHQIQIQNDFKQVKNLLVIFMTLNKSKTYFNDFE